MAANKLSVYTPDGHYGIKDEDQQRIRKALTESAETLERESRTRKLGGESHREFRASLRAEAQHLRRIAGVLGE